MALTTLMSGAFAQRSTMEAVRDIVDNGYNFWIYTPESYYTPETVTTEAVGRQKCDKRNDRQKCERR